MTKKKKIRIEAKPWDLVIGGRCREMKKEKRGRNVWGSILGIAMGVHARAVQGLLYAIDP